MLPLLASDIPFALVIDSTRPDLPEQLWLGPGVL